jgi:hypothetical protein
MSYLRKSLNVFRKALLLSWALAILWIYLGNLVNFHLYRIWGKQLMPVECSATRSKEKDASPYVKNNQYSKHIDSGSNFNFVIAEHQVTGNQYCIVISSSLDCPTSAVLDQGIQAFSFRGPPSV